MESETLLYRGGGYSVSAKTLSTPRRTYDLTRIEYVAVKQPLLALCGIIGLGLMGFAASFERYLLEWEIYSLVGGAALAIVIAARLGTLTIHSLAMRDDVGLLYGDIGRLKAIKNAVEKAIRARQQ
ncbi:MAG: hypothetical protein AAGA97_01235 [Pseudomonadota bacterium]